MLESLFAYIIVVGSYLKSGEFVWRKTFAVNLSGINIDWDATMRRNLGSVRGAILLRNNMPTIVEDANGAWLMGTGNFSITGRDYITLAFSKPEDVPAFLIDQLDYTGAVAVYIDENETPYLIDKKTKERIYVGDLHVFQHEKEEG